MEMGLGVKATLKRAATKLGRERLIPIERVVPEGRALDGKVALISGGSGGIGMAIARRLYAEGANVILGGTSAPKLERCAASIGSSCRVKWLVMDVASPLDAMAAVGDAAGLFGRIDIFVNSAGVHTDNVDFWSMMPDEFDRVWGVNLRGAYFAGRAVAEHMVRERVRGHILFVGSSRGFEPAWSPYGISKWGLRGMTQGFAQILLPHGIVVNGIAPGSTATPLIGVSEGDDIGSGENGVGRLAMPDEIAAWSAMLVGGYGDMVVGETVLVSGGRGSIDIR